MALFVLVAGVDRSADVEADTVAVPDRLGERSSAAMEFGLPVIVGQEVIVLDGATRIFGGSIDSVNVARTGRGVRWVADCVGFDEIADRRRVARAFDDMTADAIVAAIVDLELAGEGIAYDYASDVARSDPLVHYRLGEAAGNMVNAVTGVADGVVTGAIARDQPGAVADDDGAVAITAAAQRIVGPLPVAPTPPYSVEFWARSPARAGTGFREVALEAAGLYPRFGMASGPNSRPIAFLAGNCWQYADVAPNHFADDAWHHLAFVIPSDDPTEAVIYGDGEPLDIFATLDTEAATPPSATVRVWDTSGNAIGTATDEVAVYDRALTAAEVASHYTTGLDRLLQAAPLVDRAVFNWAPAGAAFRELAELVGYEWTVDPYKRLRFFARSSNPAPLAIVTGDGIAANLKVRRTREQYRNTQLLRAGTAETAERTEQVRGDGVTKAWVLQYPVARAPVITLGGVGPPRTVGIRGLDTLKEFYWQKGDRTISTELQIEAPPTDPVIHVTYVGQYPLMVVATDAEQIAERQAVGGGTGIYEAVDDDPAIETRQLAEQKASALLQRLARILNRVSFDTRTPGLRAGQLLNISDPDLGLAGDYLLEQVDARPIGAGVNLRMTYRVSALDGTRVGGWVEFFRKLADQGRRFTIRENEALGMLRVLPQVIELADELTLTPAAYTDALVDVAQVNLSEVAP